MCTTEKQNQSAVTQIAEDSSLCCLQVECVPPETAQGSILHLAPRAAWHKAYFFKSSWVLDQTGT